MRSGGSAQPVRHLDDARDAGTETDAVVRARNVVVHRLRNRDDLHAFLEQPHRVAERVVAADRDEVLDAEPFQVLQHLRGKIVALGLVAFAKMSRHILFLHAAGIGPRRMQECAASAAGAIDSFFGELLVIVGIVEIFFANHIDQALPSAAQANDLVPLAQRSNRNRTNRRIQPRDVSPARQYADDALLTTTDCHDGLCLPVDE